MELEEREYARIAEIDDGDSPPPVPDYADESNANGIVAEVTGLKAKDSSRKSSFSLQLLFSFPELICRLFVRRTLTCTARKSSSPRGGEGKNCKYSRRKNYGSE